MTVAQQSTPYANLSNASFCLYFRLLFTHCKSLPAVALASLRNLQARCIRIKQNRQASVCLLYKEASAL
jgi:hypothetical protein